MVEIRDQVFHAGRVRLNGRDDPGRKSLDRLAGLREESPLRLDSRPRVGRSEGLPRLGEGLTTPPIRGPQVSSEPPVRSRASRTWAMLIKRVYEVDPLACPQCGGQMKVVAFIEPPKGEVIEKILRHCGLWHPSAPRGPPAGDGSVHNPDDASDEPRELTYVDIDTFEATF